MLILNRRHLKPRSQAPARPAQNAASQGNYPWRVASSVMDGISTVMRQVGRLSEKPSFQHHRNADGSVAVFSDPAEALDVVDRLNSPRHSG